jgi:MFS family permease
MKSLTFLIIGLSIADLLAAIDTTAVSIALPKIARTFDLNIGGVAWAQTIYILSLVIFLIPFGKIGDSFGHKKNFFTGLLLFSISSLGSSFAPNYILLLFFRIIQGMGAAILYTASGALIAHHWKKTEIAFGLTAAFFSIGLLIGPVLGGVLADQQVLNIDGWRWIFLINVPLVVISALLVRKNSTETSHRGKLTKDIIGFLLLVSTLAFLVLTLTQPLNKLLYCFASLVSAGLLVTLERKQKDPLLEFLIFKNQTFSAISIFTAVLMFSLTALTFISTFYLQEVLNLNSTKAGLMMIPIFLGMGTFSLIAGFIHNWKVGTIISSCLIIAGLVIMAGVSPQDSYFSGLFWGFLVVSAGAGFMMTNTFAAALGSVRKNLTGVAAGYINTVQQIGALSGLSFVAYKDILKDYANLYWILAFISTIALAASLAVKNTKGERQ